MFQGIERREGEGEKIHEQMNTWVWNGIPEIKSEIRFLDKEFKKDSTFERQAGMFNHSLSALQADKLPPYSSKTGFFNYKQ